VNVPFEVPVRTLDPLLPSTLTLVFKAIFSSVGAPGAAEILEQIPEVHLCLLLSIALRERIRVD